MHKKFSPQTRRKMIALGTIGSMLINPLKASSKLAIASKKKFKLSKGHTLLFQGDSITDAGRDKNSR